MKLIIAILLLAITTFAQNTTYKDGTDCNCEWIRNLYFESGELMEETPYINNEINGIVKVYWLGVLTAEIHVINGWYHGIHKTYFKSGELMKEILYVNGNKHGVEKHYFENGTLAGTATYKNDKLVGYKKCTDGRFGNESLNCLN